MGRAHRHDPEAGEQKHKPVVGDKITLTCPDGSKRHSVVIELLSCAKVEISGVGVMMPMRDVGAAGDVRVLEANISCVRVEIDLEPGDTYEGPGKPMMVLPLGGVTTDRGSGVSSRGSGVSSRGSGVTRPRGASAGRRF